MTARTMGMLCVLGLAASLAAPALARPRATRLAPAGPAHAQVIDSARRLDVNRVRLVVSNVGSLGFDLQAMDAGLWYPAGSPKTLLFASGLWIGEGFDNGLDTRVTVAEYSQEFVPGPMSGTGPGNPADPANRVWKVVRWSGDPQDTAHVERAPGDRSIDVLVHHSWSEYMAGAVPKGAPWKLHRLAATSTPDPSDSVDVPGPDVLGDQMAWCVFNDADPFAHTNSAGGTAPLRAEVEQLVFGFDDPGPLGDALFVRWRIRNRYPWTWWNCRAGFWADPDIGGSAGFTDDKVGCDTVRAIGFAYNGDAMDGGYGPNPPVLGFHVLPPGPLVTPGARAGMGAFRGFVNGTDPASEAESFRALEGRYADGEPIVNPDGTWTRYQYSGDPVGGSGSLDPLATDKRMLTGCAPRNVPVGDSLEVWVALVVAPEAGVPAALTGLGCRSRYVDSVFASGFARPFPAVVVCSTPINCPRSAQYWAERGAGGSTPLFDAAAAGIDQQSVTFDFGTAYRDSLRAVLARDGDARQAAHREFAALLANYVANRDRLLPVGELPIVLSPLTPVNCAGIPETIVGELTTTAATQRVVSGTYQDFVTAHRRALEGYNWGGSGFGGGAGSGYDFFGSSLNPATRPDSFPALVRLRFDRAETQKAHRYLRRQLADGSWPETGRGYLYGGFVDVPFTVRDEASGEQLDVAFVEKVVTDYAGTIQPPAAQIASFDSTWSPTSEADGGREYLYVYKWPYTGSPRPEMMVDGVPLDGSKPTLFALWCRLRSSTDVIDDGDAFDLSFDFPPVPGVDHVLRGLRPLPLSDPAVEERYRHIADCLGAINRGETVGPICDEPTPALVSLVMAEAAPGLVRLEWRLAEYGPVTVERREEGGPWLELAGRLPDGEGRLVVEDRDVEPGRRYAYRLRFGSAYAGEVAVEVPFRHRLSLAGFRPNPAAGTAAVAFTLASSSPARIEVLDVAGRRVLARTIERPSAGLRVLPLADVRLAPGVYVLRLEQGGEHRAVRGVVLR